MDHVSSLAVSLLVPFGSAIDPDGKEGTASILTEFFSKGAGSWNAKELSGEYENLGIHKSQSAGTEVSMFSMAMLAENLPRALELLRIQVLEPTFPEEELAPVKLLALQDLKAIEDEPSALAMQHLTKNFYPEPFNRSQLGTVDGISAISLESLKEHYSKQFVPDPAVISFAGNFVWEDIVAAVEKEFGAWTGSTKLLPIGSFRSNDFVTHVPKDTSQVQIALAYPSVSYDDDHYYAARVANGVLSGGMSGRLFVEVREKRGLVYGVSSSHSAARGRAGVFASAGTTPENADETLEVMLEQLRGVGDGVSDKELARAKADLKSRLIMQSESTSARSSALINDWWNLGRLRTLSEIKAGVEGVTSSDIVAYYKECPPKPITLVALGPKSLEIPA
jgi:predicted Zn-dependent peptidase